MKKILLFLILLSTVSFGQISKSVFTQAQKDTIKKIAGDSSQVAETRAKSYTDTQFNANPKGWRNSAQAKQDAIDTVSALPLSSNPTTDSYILGETGTGLRKFVLDELPISNNIQQALGQYAPDSRVTTLENDIDSLFALYNYLSAVIDTIRNNSGNPFPSSPTNLVATGGDGRITLSWTPSTSTHTSQVIYYKPGGLDVAYSQLAVVSNSTTSYVHTGLGYSQTYSYYVQAVKDSVYSNPSNIASAITNSQIAGGFTPDLAGLFKGNATSDFSYSSVEGSNTVSTDTGWYKIYWDSTQAYHETAYLQKTFTAQNDSVFAGVLAYISNTLHTWAASSRIMLWGLIDTVSGSTIAVFAVGTDANRLPSNWRLTSKNGVSTTTETPVTAFGKGFVRLQIAVKIGAAGNVSYYKNDTLIASHNVDLSGVSVNAIVIGQTSFNGSHEPAKSSIWYDNIYVDSRSKQTGEWWTDTYQSGEGENGWFVNKNATGLNNGTSWANAWNSFSAINWTNIQPGDTLYISGGTDSTIYNEQLTIGKSGTSGNPIVITKGKTTGHNGKVVIDGQGIRSYGVNFGSTQYIKLEKVWVKNAISRNINLRTSNCIVSACSLFISSGATCGIDVRGSNNIIEYNYAETDVTGGQYDFVQCTSGGSHIFRYNTIILKNADVSQHCDGLQFYSPFTDGMTMQIYGNYIYQNNTKTTNAQGIYIEGLTAGAMDNTDWIIYNNVINIPYAKNGITIRNNNARATIYSNTIYQGSSVASPGFWIQDDNNTSIDSIIIKNNIFYSASTTIEPINIVETFQAGCNVTNNLIYSPMSNPIRYTGSGRSLATWNGYSFVGTDIAGDPMFTNASAQNFTLQSTSPARDAGATLGSPYNIDILGVSRPQGVAYDIGAYEYVP